MRELAQPYTLVGPPVKRPVLAPLAVFSSTTVYVCLSTSAFVIKYWETVKQILLKHVNNDFY